jgi:hypothetical protein
MSLLVEARARIARVTDAQLRKRYEDALRKSYVWDGIGEDKLPLSAHDIVATSGISADALEDTLVLLGKRKVAVYGPEFGATMTESLVKKKLTATTYSAHFKDNREALISGGKLLLTYAESRSFFGVRSRGDF